MAYASTMRSEPSFGQALWLSLGLHTALVVAVAASSFFARRGESWGGTEGGAVTVGLVRNLSGVPLPRPDAVTASRVVDESKGLYKSEPAAAVKTPEATALAEFSKSRPPKYVSRPSKVLEDETVPPPNAVPYGGGGAPTVPYSQFTMAGQTQGGLGMSGPGGGDFGGRFPWYVEAVRRRISSNWLQSTIDPGLRWAPRVVVTFQILRNGTIANVEVLRSSSNASVDFSARRAVLDSSPVERLPAGYGGASVSVEFWFEFRR
jgi:protein TonB